MNLTDHRHHPNNIAQRAVTSRLWVWSCVPLSANLGSLFDSSYRLLRTACITYSPQGRLQTTRHAWEIQKNLLHISHNSVDISSSNPSWIKKIWPRQLQTQGKSLLPIARPRNIKNNQRESILMMINSPSVTDMINISLKGRQRSLLMRTVILSLIRPASNPKISTKPSLRRKGVRPRQRKSRLWLVMAMMMPHLLTWWA